MKKKIFSIVGVAAFAVAVAFNINTSLSDNAEMDMTLAQIEALARNEIPEVVIGCNRSNCKGGTCHKFSEPWNSSCPCAFSGYSWQGCYAG